MLGNTHASELGYWLMHQVTYQTVQILYWVAVSISWADLECQITSVNRLTIVYKMMLQVLSVNAVTINKYISSWCDIGQYKRDEERVHTTSSVTWHFCTCSTFSIFNLATPLSLQETLPTRCSLVLPQLQPMFFNKIGLLYLSHDFAKLVSHIHLHHRFKLLFLRQFLIDSPEI